MTDLKQIFEMSSSLSLTANNTEANSVPVESDHEDEPNNNDAEDTTDMDGDSDSDEDDELNVYCEALLQTLPPLHYAVTTRNIQKVKELKTSLKSDKEWIDMMFLRTKTIDELEREGKCDVLQHIGPRMGGAAALA